MIKLYLADISMLNDPLIDKSKISILPIKRQNKILKYNIENDRKRSLGAGLIIDKILLDNNINANSIHFGSNGKPYADNIFFNVAHSGNFAFGVSSKNDIGCDIEIIKKPHLNIAKRFFTENEYNYILNSKNDTSSFYKIWTIKESYIKFTGDGLRTPLNSFEINFSNNEIYITESNKKVPCFITQFKFKNHSFAICSTEKPAQKIEFIYI